MSYRVRLTRSSLSFLSRVRSGTPEWVGTTLTEITGEGHKGRTGPPTCGPTNVSVAGRGEEGRGVERRTVGTVTETTDDSLLVFIGRSV